MATSKGKTGKSSESSKSQAKGSQKGNVEDIRAAGTQEMAR
jgi:hypothetical protein